jgi:hypothetical protein
VADLDANGTPDVVSGNLDGTFSVAYLPEPVPSALLAAEAALLALLDGIRGLRLRGC